MILENQPQLRSLSAEDKMLLASELWEAAADEAAKSNEEMVGLVGDLYRDYLLHSDRVSPWSEVRGRVQNRRSEPTRGSDA